MYCRYQCLKMNVDILRVIQIGVTFSDDDGNFPVDTPCTWQFHFSFSLQNDTYAPLPPPPPTPPIHSAHFRITYDTLPSTRPQASA